MGLKGLDLGVPPDQFLLVKAVELCPELGGHLVEGIREVFKFPAAGLDVHLAAPLALLYVRRVGHQSVNGRGDLLPEEAEREQQQEQQRQSHGRQQPGIGENPASTTAPSGAVWRKAVISFSACAALLESICPHSATVSTPFSTPLTTLGRKDKMFYMEQGFQIYDLYGSGSRRAGGGHAGIRSRCLQKLHL